MTIRHDAFIGSFSIATIIETGKSECPYIILSKYKGIDIYEERLSLEAARGYIYDHLPKDVEIKFITYTVN